MSAKEWVLANKVRTGLGIVAALAGIVVLPISFVTWAENQTAEQVKDSALIQQGKLEAVQSQASRELAKQSAKHDYDFYDVRIQQAEEELVDLEEDADAGVQLTASQERKMRRLEGQVENFAVQQQVALDELAKLETQDET